MLEQAVRYAREHDQPALWDRSPRSYGVALYDDATKKLRPPTDEEAAILLNRDPDIAREWRKWNAMTQNEGTLIILDSERVQAVLEAANEEEEGDDEVMGLA